MFLKAVGAAPAVQTIANVPTTSKASGVYWFHVCPPLVVFSGEIYPTMGCAVWPNVPAPVSVAPRVSRGATAVRHWRSPAL
jgi:hypothetical protein